MADRREWLLRLVGRDDLSPAFDSAARSAGRFDDRVKAVETDAQRLDRQIAETKTKIAELGQEIRKTGDLSLFKELSRQQRDLKRLTGLKDMFAELGEDGAKGFAASFSARIGPLLARAPIHPALLGAIAASMPALGALVSAGVLAGLSGGVVAAGVRLAFTDPRIKGEAESLGKELGATLASASRSFVPATLGAMAQIRRTVAGLEGDLRQTFQAGAAYVAPLTRAVTNLADGILPRLPRVIERAAPIFAALEDGAVVLGKAVGGALDAISEGAGGAALVVRDLLTNVAVGVRNIGEVIGFLSKAYSLIRAATAIDKQAVITQLARDQAAAGAYKAELDKLVSGLQSTGHAASTTAAEIRSLDQMLEDFANEATTAFNAETRFGEVLDEVTTKAVHHGAGIDAGTKKGRANRDMLDKLAAQTRESAKALDGMAGGQEKANQIMATGYKRFMAVADAMGLDKKTAQALAVQMGLIPKTTKTEHKSNAAQAKAEAERVKRKLEEIERTYFARVKVSYYEAGAKSGSLGAVGQREYGGPVKKGHAYVVGERRPEVFVPDRDGRVIPSVERYLSATGAGSRGGSTNGQVRVIISAEGLMDAVVRQLRHFVRVEAQGDVQVAFGP